MDGTMERAGNFLPRADETTGTGNQVNRNVVSLTAPASTAAEQFRSSTTGSSGCASCSR